MSRPFLVAACIALPSFAYLLFSRRLDLLSARGAELRSRRARPLTSEIGLVILGWGSPARLYAEVRETLCLIREQQQEVDFTFEIYLKSAQGDATKHSSLNLFTITPPVTMHIAICFPVKGLVSENKMLQLGNTIKAALAKQQQQQVAVYLVERSVYTEYGDYDGPAQLEWNAKQTRADWPLEEKSPYIIAHTAIPKPARFAHKSNLQWSREDWFPKQSPMSEMMQPRARYVRNVVIRTNDDAEAPPFAGLIIEAWPSKRHMDNPFLFFHASNVFEVALHIMVMVGNVMQFADLTVLQGSILEEWLE